MDLKPPTAIVHLGPSKKIAGTSSEFLIIMRLVDEFAQHVPPGRAHQLQHGVFVCDLDACYPAILTLIQEAKNYAACVFVSEIGDAPVLLSPQYQEAAAFLRTMGRRVQFTGPEVS